MLHQNGKAGGIEDFVFYNNLSVYSGAVVHTGDNRDGQGDGDDEQINIDFTKIPDTIHRIGITVTIHDADRRNQNFGQVSNAFVRLLDEQSGSEILRYDLGEDFSVETAVVVCELYRHGPDWKFQAIGSGFSGGLSALAHNYGLDAK
jgi:tellurium resistance protein TerD